jgi:hypothetical protein
MTAHGHAHPDFADAAARFAKTYEEGIRSLAEALKPASRSV